MQKVPLFEFTEPFIYKDKKTNKKWFVSYKIKYIGKDKNFVRQKVYGKNLNREPNLKQRVEDARDLLENIHDLLKAGIDPRSGETARAAANEREKFEKRHTFEYLYDFYIQLKGFKNPAPKQSKSAANVKRFLENRLKPFLVENKLENDLRNVEKGHIVEFLNKYYFNPDPKLKWNNTTYNNSKQWVSWFFGSLIDEDKLKMQNPCDTITSKPSKGMKRYEVYTKAELELLFTYLDKSDHNLKTICMMIFHGYIRESELERIKVSSIDLSARMIRMQASDSKGHSDGLERDVIISKELLVALTKHINQCETNPDYFLFGKRFYPYPTRVGAGWQVKFRECLKELTELHPDKFNRPGLSLYSLKHSGVTYFIKDNIQKSGSLKTLRFVQSQCRHEDFRTTERYIRKLPVDIGEYDEFITAGY